MRLFPGKWDYSLQVRDFKFVSVGVLVTEFGSWQLLLFVKVRKAGKSVTNILSFSPTYFVSNIGRKHQCSLKVWNLKKVAKIPRYFSFSAIALPSTMVSAVSRQAVKPFCSERIEISGHPVFRLQNDGSYINDLDARIVQNSEDRAWFIIGLRNKGKD